MQLLVKVKAIEMLLLTMLGKILTGLLGVGQKRRRQRCLRCILEVVRIYDDENIYKMMMAYLQDHPSTPSIMMMWMMMMIAMTMF